MNIQQICVYCASSNRIAPHFFEAAEKLANILVDQQITLVYGGGKTGLMGKLADTMISRKGKVIGIMPHFMKEVELQHNGVSELHFVGDMHERKKKFLEGTDALVALPGGVGTFEELLEALTLKRLGLFTHPIVVLNTHGYYDPLIEMLNRAVEEQFMQPIHLDMWRVVSEPEEVLPAIQEAPGWDASAIRFVKS